MSQKWSPQKKPTKVKKIEGPLKPEAFHISGNAYTNPPSENSFSVLKTRPRGNLEPIGQLPRYETPPGDARKK
jgi:hypothetical protein